MAGLSRPPCRSLTNLSTNTVCASCSRQRWASTTSSPKQKIVILGSGWAGYAAARTISASKATRAVISPRSHFAFTPLLASTAVGTLEFRAAIEPVRRLAIDEFHQAWASNIDFKNKVIHLESNAHDDASAKTSPTRGYGQGEKFDMTYDKLVIAVGCYSQTFGVEGVEKHANFLRDVGDARAIRLRVLGNFETADLPTTSDEERRRLLHFAVVGGGPTGIEFAAELHDLIHDDLARMYPALTKFCAITVYDIAPKVLPMFDHKLAAYATELFRRQGIKVKTEHHLTRVRQADDGTLMLQIKEESDEVGAGMVVWSTGLMQNPLVRSIVDGDIPGVGRIAKDARTGGIVTDAHLRVQLESGESETATLPDVYAIGDCAAVQGGPYPATAQVASQQAVYLGRQINKGTDMEGGKPFKFRNWGVMTYLGSWRAIHQSETDNLRGWAAWVLWRGAYLTRSMSMRNKIMIPVYWVVTWIFGRDISRF